MKILKYLTILLAGLGISGLIWLLNPSSVVSQPTVQLQTEPSLEAVIVDDTVVKFKLQALDTDQKFLSDAKIDIRLLMPSPTPWLTSDFPIIEGTELLHLGAISPQGSLEFEKVLPIRGNYRLEVAVNPEVEGSFQPFKESIVIKIPESAVRYRNLAILATILLISGVGSGWILGGDQIINEGEIAPHPVRLLLSGMTVIAIIALLFVNFSAEMATATAEINEVAEVSPAIAQNKGIQIGLSGDSQAVVGELASQTVTVTDLLTGEPIANIPISVQSVAIESDAVMFTYQGTSDSMGKLTWQEQFFDGAPHRVTATVLPVGKESDSASTLQVSQDIEVSAIAPPLFVRFISLFYLTLIFVVGLVGGFWTRKLGVSS